MSDKVWFQQCQVQLALSQMDEDISSLSNQNWFYRIPFAREWYRWTQSAEGWFMDVDFAIRAGRFGF